MDRLAGWWDRGSLGPGFCEEIFGKYIKKKKNAHTGCKSTVPANLRVVLEQQRMTTVTVDKHMKENTVKKLDFDGKLYDHNLSGLKKKSTYLGNGTCSIQCAVERYDGFGEINGRESDRKNPSLTSTSKTETRDEKTRKIPNLRIEWELSLRRGSGPPTPVGRYTKRPFTTNVSKRN